MPDPREVLTRAARDPDLVVSYGDEPNQIADVRLPSGGNAPLVLFWHGGFWRAAYDRSHTGPLAEDLADRGYAVASVEYRRTGQPGGGWPGTFHDVALAMHKLPELIADAAPGRIDPGRVVLAGHSAGGQLALWAAARHRLPATLEWATSGPPAIEGVLALAPVCDLGLAHQLDLDGGAVEVLLGGGPSDVPERYSATDPVHLPPLGVAVSLVHGRQDEHVPITFSREYASICRQHEVPVRLVEVPDAEHFALIDPASPAWPQVLTSLDMLLSATC